MHHRVAFYLPRLNHLKVVAPLIGHISHHHAKNFSLHILCPGWPITKSYLQPTINDLTDLFGDSVGLHMLESPEHFIKIVRLNSFSTIISVGPSLSDIRNSEAWRVMVETRSLGVKWVSLPHTFEAELFTVMDPESILKLWDLVCVMGKRSVDFVERNLRGKSSGLEQAAREKIVISGYPELDGINSSFEADTIRQKYGLPTRKRLVFISTAPTFYSRSIQLNGLELRFRGISSCPARALLTIPTTWRYPVLVSYKQYLSKLRQFADSNDACLVAKTRKKHSDPDYLYEYVDYVIDDVSYFPFTTLELLSVSSLYFGFYSAAALEAIASNLYTITALFVPPEEVDRTRLHRRYRKHYFAAPDTIWNTPGVSHLIHGSKRSASSALDQFAASDLDEYLVDEEKRIRLLDQFISFRGNSSERFVEVLSSLW